MGAAIRSSVVEDARPIAEVHVASWRWAYRGQLPDDVLERLSVDDREETWRGMIAEDPRSVSVAVEGDRIVGFASTGATRDDDAPGGTGELYAIYVQPEVVGTGVGHALLERGERGLRAAGFVRATLWVLEGNDRARRFYERAGWTWDGTTSDHEFECANRPIVRYARDL